MHRARVEFMTAFNQLQAALEKKIDEIVTAIHETGFRRALTDRLHKFEARHEELQQRLAAVPPKIPDIHPNIAGIYARKVARLAEALEKPDERDAAASAIRGLIERIVLTPGADGGDLHITLQGDFGAILEWTGNGHKKEVTDTPGSGMSVSVVAGAGFEPITFRL